jgi:ABC-type Fe3+ transport system substrate-binding protein
LQPADTTVPGETVTTSDGGATTTAAQAWQPGDAWDAGAPAEWEGILAAGREEGVVVVGGFPFLEEAMEEAFERDTGIRLDYVGGGGGDISARFEQEARSGNMSMDLILGGGGELETVYPDDLLASVKDQLILPGVQDGPWWYGGARGWYDTAGEYFFLGSAWVFGYITVNADLVDPASITSWEDLLKPEFTGQIIAFDPLAIGAGQGAASAMVGSGAVSLDTLEQLLVDQEMDFVEDNTQVVEALARETHSVALFALQSQIERFKGEGFNLEAVNPGDYPGYVSSGFSVVKLAEARPHPNAAQVFVNWYASVPGQQVYQDVLLETSRRLDVDRSGLPEYVIPQEGVDYFDDSTEEFRLTGRREAVDAIVEMLGGQ